MYEGHTPSRNVVSNMMFELGITLALSALIVARCALPGLLAASNSESSESSLTTWSSDRCFHPSYYTP
ncbi:hypothetical protein BDR05DRAFT_969448 [Suillus weaverae]|nr:hypothetical protein BDR05DRAFT_969448 [Suillus weaverae]